MTIPKLIVASSVAFLCSLTVSTGVSQAFQGGALGDPTKEFTNPLTKPFLDKAVPSLSARLVGDNRPGYLAMTTLALIKAGVPKDRPDITTALNTLAARVSSSAYNAVEGADKGVYEAAAILIALANGDPDRFKPQIENLAAYITSRQTPWGAWGYVVHSSTPGSGDTSVTQFALLGLWEATNLEIKVSPTVFDRAADWLIKSQKTSGGFVYQPLSNELSESVSLTAAGTGSMLICRSQLLRNRPKDPEMLGEKPRSKLLIPIDADGNEIDESDSQARPRGMITSMDALRRGIERGLGWLAANYGVDQMYGQTPYYALYSLERVASLGEVETLGTKKWYDIGMELISSRADQSGLVSAQYGEDVNTAWAILFAARSTRDSIRRAERRRLGAANMLGGIGLPKNLNDLVIRGGRVGVSPMTGAVEGMLEALNDPNLQDTASIEAGLMDAYGRQGAVALKPHRDRLIRLTRSPDPQLRLIAIWCLARLGESDVVPLLLGALEDSDDLVAVEAGKGLQFLSRRLVGFGPEIPEAADRSSATEVKRKAARAWRDYFKSAQESPRKTTTAANGERNRS